jgi:hypothetical protein
MSQRRSNIAWALMWPTGHILSRNPGVPAIFFTRKDARTWLYNLTYETVKIVKMAQCKEEK